ncbi:MAG: hypothetical protein O2979_06855 [Proteobacteria bacterium]|nr:hypothetical protein [Pseudomonadota bacterium]
MVRAATALILALALAAPCSAGAAYGGYFASTGTMLPVWQKSRALHWFGWFAFFPTTELYGGASLN